MAVEMDEYLRKRHSVSKLICSSRVYDEVQAESHDRASTGNRYRYRSRNCDKKGM